jgi:hypothetical protein
MSQLVMTLLYYFEDIRRKFFGRNFINRTEQLQPVLVMIQGERLQHGR